MIFQFNKEKSIIIFTTDNLYMVMSRAKGNMRLDITGWGENVTHCAINLKLTIQPNCTGENQNPSKKTSCLDSSRIWKYKPITWTRPDVQTKWKLTLDSTCRWFSRSRRLQSEYQSKWKKYKHIELAAELRKVWNIVATVILYIIGTHERVRLEVTIEKGAGWVRNQMWNRDHADCSIFLNRLEYWEDSWKPEEYCCHLNSMKE